MSESRKFVGGQMGFELIPGTDAFYGLISYDADGNERPEAEGLMSARVVEKALAESITDVFFFCHGWKGDQQSARDQYEKWISAFATSEDRKAAPDRFPGFKPMYIGLHWPSLPFGDEELRAGAFAASGAVGIASLLESYAARLGDHLKIRRPLEVILNEARRNSSPDELPTQIRQAYSELNEALGLGGDGVVDAPPDADRDEFDAQDSYEASGEEGSSFGEGRNLGGILGPLRQLSYWTMKKRARSIGEGGMHLFLKDLQNATASRKTRVHLMGHSFGTIVVSSMVGGPQGRAFLPRPLESLVLVQGAVSLWCYAPSIPYTKWLRNAGPGYFSHLLSGRKLLGPIVTTRSKYDDAVGVLYPWASRIKGAPQFAAGLPKYGAIGTYGIQGVPNDIRTDLVMLPATGTYQFEPAKIYNLDGAQFIFHKEGISGAHSDIAGPEVAHAIWAAAFALTH